MSGCASSSELQLVVSSLTGEQSKATLTLSKGAAAKGKAQFEVELARPSSDSELASRTAHEIEAEATSETKPKKDQDPNEDIFVSSAEHATKNQAEGCLCAPSEDPTRTCTRSS